MCIFGGGGGGGESAAVGSDPRMVGQRVPIVRDPAPVVQSPKLPPSVAAELPDQSALRRNQAAAAKLTMLSGVQGVPLSSLSLGKPTLLGAT